MLKTHWIQFPKTWTYFMRDGAHEHHTSVYLQVILQNKVPLDVLPSLYTRYSHLETPSPLTHLESSSGHSPKASNKPRTQAKKNAFITHQPHRPGLYISHAHPPHWCQNIFREALLVIVPFQLPHICVGSSVICIKRPGYRCWRWTKEPFAQCTLFANGGRWLKIIGGSVIGGRYGKYTFTGDGNSGRSRGSAPWYEGHVSEKLPLHISAHRVWEVVDCIV